MPDRKTFTMPMDTSLEDLFEDLKITFGKTTRVEVFKLSLAILKVAREAVENHQKLVLADDKGRIVKEIIL